MIASARMTNEELWLAKRLAEALKTGLIDIVPRTGAADDLLLNADRNPNTAGAKLLGVTTEPGARLGTILERVRAGQIKAVLALGEDLTDCGFSPEDMARLPVLIAMNSLSSMTTTHAAVVLPSATFAEKRGTMINATGRLQRLNRAIRSPGEARDDWEILRDLIQQLTGSNGIYLIEDVFKQMAESIPQLHGLTLSRVGDLGCEILKPSTAEQPEAAPV